MHLKTKVISAVGIAAVVAAGGFAFTATSTIDDAQAYVGATGQDVSGVTVTDVRYSYANPNATDTTTAVTFTTAQTLDPTHDLLTVKVTDGATTPATKTMTNLTDGGCVNNGGSGGAGHDIVCTIPSSGMVNLVHLGIVVTQQ